jgi:hypothetical protein
MVAAAIVRSLRADGPATRQELAERVYSGMWGPGCFPLALRTVLDEGIVERADSRFTVKEDRSAEGRQSADSRFAA